MAAARVVSEADSRATMNPKIGLVQMCSGNDKASNLEECRRLIDEAVSQGCHLIALPECFFFVGARPGESQAAAEPLSGPTIQEYCNIARERHVWLSLGGFPERPDEGQELDNEGRTKIFNTHVIVDAGGQIAAVYRKIHLFDAPFVGLIESKQALAGNNVVACESSVGKLGVTVCYDVRFPELYQKLRFSHGCEVLLVPAAFTMKTGEAHWELLMKARAVECQCYVIAAAQAGLHNEDGNRRTSWGHSIAVDPWGRVVAEMDGLETGIRVIEVDKALLQQTRLEMPIDSHRRYDIYGPDAPSA